MRHSANRRVATGTQSGVFCSILYPTRDEQKTLSRRILLCWREWISTDGASQRMRCASDHDGLALNPTSIRATRRAESRCRCPGIGRGHARPNACLIVLWPDAASATMSPMSRPVVVPADATSSSLATPASGYRVSNGYHRSSFARTHLAATPRAPTPTLPAQMRRNICCASFPRAVCPAIN